MHTDSAAHDGSDAIVASALARGVPVVSGKQMLDWLDGRNGSSFGSIAWNSGNTLTFTSTPRAGATGLRGMLPTEFGSATLTALTRDGSAVSFTHGDHQGRRVRHLPRHQRRLQARPTAPPPTRPRPAISAVTATATANGTATVSWTTNEASNSRVDYGTDPGQPGPERTRPPT